MTAGQYYVLAAVVAVVTLGGHIGNYILTLRLRAEFADLRREFEKWARHEFVPAATWHDRYVGHERRIQNLEAKCI